MTGRLPRILALTGLTVVLLIVALWLSGGLSEVERWAAVRQRAVQNLMAGALRALRAGQPGAVASLLWLCFGYGVFHAVGPGHGKLVIGSYGFGLRVPVLRLAALSVAASLAQAATAVALVWTGIAALNLGRETLTDLGERAMLQLSTLLVAGVGLWLALRGLRMLRAQTHHDTCGCGHAHGPTPAQVAQSGSLRDGLLVVAGIAARPCTGALFLLILTWRMEIFGMGILGAFAMGLGTAFVTVAVAGLAAWARRGSLALLPPDGPLGSTARWLPGVMQLAAGALIAIVSLMVLV